MKDPIPKLFITKVEGNPSEWYLSFERPEFQATEVLKIDYETAAALLKYKGTLGVQELAKMTLPT